MRQLLARAAGLMIRSKSQSPSIATKRISPALRRRLVPLAWREGSRCAAAALPNDHVANPIDKKSRNQHGKENRLLHADGEGQDGGGHDPHEGFAEETAGPVRLGAAGRQFRSQCGQKAWHCIAVRTIAFTL